MESTVSWYLNEINRLPLLTVDQEITLGHQVQRMLHLSEKPEAERTKEERKAIRIGERAFKRFFESNLKLVVSVAKKYRIVASTMTLEDLIQEGNIGLHQAVAKFDPTRGYRFSTYAYWWIRQGINRGLAATDRTIRVPITVIERLQKIRKYALEINETEGRNPTIKELAVELDTSEENIELALSNYYRVSSLDNEVQGSSDGKAAGTILDTIVGDERDLLDQVDEAHLFDSLHGFISELDPDQQKIIHNKYFKHPKDMASHEKLSSEFGYGRYKVSTREKQALRILMLRMREKHQL